MEDKAQKYIDFWGKHNLGSRLSLVAMIIAYLYVIYTGKSTEIIQTTSDVLLIGFMTVTLGANALVEIAKLYFSKAKD